MTETEAKALALVNEVCAEWEVSPATEDEMDGSACFAALIRAIEQFEAFKQEVSDTVDAAKRTYGGHRQAFDQLERFIIPKPDPLVEALLETFPRANGAEGMAADLRAALAARGLEIREKQP